MCRYIFALLLLNYTYLSLGVPVPLKPSVSLANLLTTLSNNCDNKFISDQIKNKLGNCSDIGSPHKEKQLKCFLFYDINKQLCATPESNLELMADYSSKIKEEQEVDLLCGTTKDWVFTNLTEFPHYKSTVETIFNRTSGCLKVCSVDDLISDDSDFFCKYFKWGTDHLKNKNHMPQPLPEEGNIENKVLDTAPNDVLDVEIKKYTTSNAPNILSEAASVKNDEATKTEVAKQETSPNNNPDTSSANSAPSVQSELKLENVKETVPPVEDPVAPINQADKPAEISNPELIIKDSKPESQDSTLTKPDSDKSQKYEVDKEIQQLNNELEHKEPAVLETPDQSKPKQPSEADEYQDSDEGKDGLSDIQGDDDGDDAMPVDVNKINKLEEQKEEKQESQSLKTIVYGITGESALYPSFAQDAYADEDNNDHFISFFVTAVIMVVLIYVLYHNKNKVCKVFFRMIVEGRQTGRRRNSRGHAYRRLDTLEQAMSTNTAAPPSKIIY